VIEPNTSIILRFIITKIVQGIRILASSNFIAVLMLVGVLALPAPDLSINSTRELDTFLALD
jgi:hypothetical protein